MRKISIVFLTLLGMGFSYPILATSGACSSHDGVNCSKVDISDGSVVCNDGWEDGSVLYEDMAMCTDWKPKRSFDGAYEISSEEWFNKFKSAIEASLKFGQTATMLIADGTIYGMQKITSDAKINCPSSLLFEYCKATHKNKIIDRYNGFNGHFSIYVKERDVDLLDLISIYYFPIGSMVPHHAITEEQFFEYPKTDPVNGKMLAVLTQTKLSIEEVDKIQKAPTSIITPDNPVVSVSLADTWLEEQIANQSPIDSLLVNKLLGRILLQAEDHGEAWYLDPISKKRYYMKNGEVAYQMLRSFGLGITNTDLEKLQKGDKTLIAKMKGRILLQVQSHGEAYYIHPVTGMAHYMKDGDEAYKLMRELSLGITNINLSKIPIGKIIKK